VPVAQSGRVTIHAPVGAALTRGSGIPWAELGGVRVGVVLWGGLALLDLAHLASAPSYAALGALALLVTAASVGTGTGTALTAALTGWLLVDGFVEHRFGTLGFDGRRDGPVLALLTLIAVVTARTTRARR
jgi:hypothetical protein